MQTADLPVVSVALCTYNGEKFIRKQLDSILFQTYAAIEVVAVDDASGDDTWNILLDYAQKDKRLKPYQNSENLGYHRNFEKAINLCSGDYIALADQDDIWEKDKISILANAIQDNMMVYHDSDFIDNDDERIGNGTISARHKMYDGESCLPLILCNCISGHATLFKKELKAYFLPFNNARYHDWWIAYVAFNVGKVKYIDEVLVHYRQHQNSITDTLELRKSGTVEKAKGLGKLSVELNWLRYCAEFKHNREPVLVDEACKLFSDLVNGKNRFRCFLFMMKYYDLIFFIITKRPKGYLSKLNFVRKICFD